MNLKIFWALVFGGLAFVFGLVEANNRGTIVISEYLGTGLGYAAVWFLIGLAIDFVISFFVLAIDFVVSFFRK